MQGGGRGSYVSFILDLDELGGEDPGGEAGRSHERIGAYR